VMAWENAHVLAIFGGGNTRKHEDDGIIAPSAITAAAVVTSFALAYLLSWARAKHALMEKRVRTPPFDGVPLARGGHWLLGHMRALSVGAGGGDGDEKFGAGPESVMAKPSDPKTGLCSFFIFGTPAVSVLRGSDVRAVLNASSFRKPVAMMKRHNDEFLGPYALTALVGREWKRYRSAVHRSFTPAALAESQEAINAVGNALSASLQRAAAMEGSGQFTVKVLPLMKMATMDVFGMSALGVDLGCCSALQLSPVAKAFDHLASEYSRRVKRPLDPMSLFYWIPIPSNRRYAREKRLIRSFVSELIAKGRRDSARGKELKQSEFLTRLIKANEDKGDKGSGKAGGDDDGMSDSALTDTLMMLLFAGYDTTSITLTYTLHLLATHPEVREAILDEVSSVMGGPQQFSERGSISPPLLSDHTKLPFTGAVIKETLRLFPPAPLTTRNLEKPLELQGSVLPTHTMIIISIWLVQRHENNYPQPKEFRPDRWVRRRQLDGDRHGDADEKGVWVERPERDGAEEEDYDGREFGGGSYIPPGSRDAFCAFSGGARNCVGKVLAMQEAVTILACLLRDLTFESVPNYELRPMKSSFVQNPHDSLPMVIRPIQS